MMIDGSDDGVAITTGAASDGIFAMAGAGAGAGTGVAGGGLGAGGAAGRAMVVALNATMFAFVGAGCARAVCIFSGCNVDEFPDV